MPRPGTITGEVIVDGKKIQTFLVTAEGKMTFAKWEDGGNFIVKGEYVDYVFKFEWSTQPPPQFTLKVNYEYEV